MSKDLGKQIMEVAYKEMKKDATKMGLTFTKSGKNWNVKGDERKVKEFIKKYEK